MKLGSFCGLTPSSLCSCHQADVAQDQHKALSTSDLNLRVRQLKSVVPIDSCRIRLKSVSISDPMSVCKLTRCPECLDRLKHQKELSIGLAAKSE
jgi:hypothetical protein